MVIIVFFVILYGHRVTCLFHKALCTPLTEYIYRFPMLPQSPTGTGDSILFTGSNSVTKRCERFADFLQTRHHDTNDHRNKNKQWLFLIGESRGGSTYTYDTLNLHRQIDMIGGEPLFGFSNNVCNNNALFRDASKCTFDNWLQALYQNAYDKVPHFLTMSGTQTAILGTKINIEQIPPEFYSDFCDFLWCIRGSSVVLHVTRAASIASFLNYQAEVPERLYTANLRFTGDSVPQALTTPLTLDPELAADWVRQRDGLSQELFARLAFLSIQYTRVYYEQLHGEDFGDAHWRSLFGFLGVDASVSVADLRAKQHSRIRKGGLRTMNKTHGSIPCNQRIANWEEVRTALNGSLSVVACEMLS
jgi:hypothetical protein